MTSMNGDAASVLKVLMDNPDYVSILERCLAWEAENGGYDAFEWHAVHASERDLKRLVELGLLSIRSKSRAFTYYHVTNAQMAKKALAALAQPQPTGDWPDDLFSVVVGHQDVKNLLNLALAAPQPVHVLLVGPPATSKSLFLSELQRLPGAHLALGGAASRRGITDVLLETRCRYLLLDEVEKASGQDLNVLLRLMEHGELVVTKHRFQVKEKLNTWVFAAGNSVKLLAPELLSRFWVQHIRPYTQEEFRQVVELVLHQREGLDPERSAYIAHKLIGRTWDVRDAVRIGRMAQEPQQVDRLVKMLEQRGRE